MSRTFRRLIGGSVPDGKVLRFKGRGRKPRATKVCHDDNVGHRCEWCNSVEKRRQVPLDVMRSELEDHHYAQVSDA